MKQGKSDEEIIALLRACNPEGLDFIEKYQRDKCIAYAKSSLKEWSAAKARNCSQAEAEDLWQEALVRTYEMFCIRKAQLNCQLSTLLIQIMSNVWNSQFKKTTQSLVPGFEALQDADALELEALRQWIRQSLEKMPEPCRSMLILRYYYELSFDEIASIMGYANGDVIRNLISRCRRDFRELFPINYDEIGDYNPAFDSESPPKTQQDDLNKTGDDGDKHNMPPSN